MNTRAGILVVVSVAGVVGCNEPGGGAEPEGLCAWSEPHRLFKGADTATKVSSYGPADEFPRSIGAGADELFFQAADTVFLSGSCGEDLRDVGDMLSKDGLRYVHDDLALDCEQGTVLRRGAGGAFETVFEGDVCDSYFQTREGFFATIPAGGDGKSVQLVRLLATDAPELPTAVLHAQPLVSLTSVGYVGPRGVDLIEVERTRFLTGHWSSPFVALTTGGQVVRIDPHGSAEAVIMDGVAAVWASPGGEAFAYRPSLLDGTGGDLLVHVLATGEDHPVAASDELTDWSLPWWSADGSLLAIMLGGDAQRDRVIAVPSGQVWTTDVGTVVQREVADGGLWLSSEEGDAVREVYWEPVSGARRELWSHHPLPQGNVRAGADGLELLLTDDEPYGLQWWGEGELVVAPYDGSAAFRPGKRVSPGYTRLADGRVVTARAPATDEPWPETFELILIDPTTGTEDPIDSSVAYGRWSPWMPDAGAIHHRVIGDLLTYVVVDPSGERSGVWAVSLAHR